MHKSKHNSSGTVMIRIALVLFCLVMITTHMMSGLYARYISVGEAADEARVAAFSVQADWQGDVKLDVSDSADANGAYTFTVINKSEATVRYDVILTFESPLPYYISVKLDDVNGILAVDGKSVTFENIEELAPQTSGAQKSLNFSVTSADDFTEYAAEESYSLTVNFAAVIDCVQID